MNKIWNVDLGTLIREEDLNGRHYIVVPMTMLLEGVHTGSQGPVYYSIDELAKTPRMWNMKPIVIQHPFKGDTATDLEVYKKQGVGMIMNTHFIDGKLKAEAWIDVDLANEKCPELLVHINNKMPVEISTGLFSELVMENGMWNGESYKGKIINIRADHLAILPDKQGACSLSDGAGLLINQKFEEEKRLDVVTKTPHTVVSNQEYVAGSYVPDMGVGAEESKAPPKAQPTQFAGENYTDDPLSAVQGLMDNGISKQVIQLPGGSSLVMHIVPPKPEENNTSGIKEVPMMFDFDDIHEPPIEKEEMTAEDQPEEEIEDNIQDYKTPQEEYYGEQGLDTYVELIKNIKKNLNAYNELLSGKKIKNERPRKTENLAYFAGDPKRTKNMQPSFFDSNTGTHKPASLEMMAEGDSSITLSPFDDQDHQRYRDFVVSNPHFVEYARNGNIIKASRELGDRGDQYNRLKKNFIDHIFNAFSSLETEEMCGLMKSLFPDMVMEEMDYNKQVSLALSGLVVDEHNELSRSNQDSIIADISIKCRTYYHKLLYQYLRNSSIDRLGYLLKRPIGDGQVFGDINGLSSDYEYLTGVVVQKRNALDEYRGQREELRENGDTGRYWGELQQRITGLLNGTQQVLRSLAGEALKKLRSYTTYAFKLKENGDVDPETKYLVVAGTMGVGGNGRSQYNPVSETGIRPTELYQKERKIAIFERLFTLLYQKTVIIPAALKGHKSDLYYTDDSTPKELPSKYGLSATIKDLQKKGAAISSGVLEDYNYGVNNFNRGRIKRRNWVPKNFEKNIFLPGFDDLFAILGVEDKMNEYLGEVLNNNADPHISIDTQNKVGQELLNLFNIGKECVKMKCLFECPVDDSDVLDAGVERSNKRNNVGGDAKAHQSTNFKWVYETTRKNLDQLLYGVLTTNPELAHKLQEWLSVEYLADGSTMDIDDYRKTLLSSGYRVIAKAGDLFTLLREYRIDDKKMVDTIFEKAIKLCEDLCKNMVLFDRKMFECLWYNIGLDEILSEVYKTGVALEQAETSGKEKQVYAAFLRRFENAGLGDFFDHLVNTDDNNESVGNNQNNKPAIADQGESSPFPEEV